MGRTGGGPRLQKTPACCFVSMLMTRHNTPAHRTWTTPPHFSHRHTTMIVRTKIKAALLILAVAAAAVHAFAPVRVQLPAAGTPLRDGRGGRATAGPAGSGSDAFFFEAPLVMSAAAASSSGGSSGGGSIGSRPTAGGGAATRPLKRRAPVSSTYCKCSAPGPKPRIYPYSSGPGPPEHSPKYDPPINQPNPPPTKNKKQHTAFLDFLVGPFAADCKLAGVPSELAPFATDLHRATGHLPRADRVQALTALVSGYNCLRKRKQAGALTLVGGRTATLGAAVEMMVAVGVTLGQSDIDGPAITAALLCPCAMAGCTDAAAVEGEFGGEVAAILSGFQAMLMVESQIEMKALLSDYAKFLWYVCVHGTDIGV